MHKKYFDCNLKSQQQQEQTLYHFLESFHSRLHYSDHWSCYPTDAVGQ